MLEHWLQGQGEDQRLKWVAVPHATLRLDGGGTFRCGTFRRCLPATLPCRMPIGRLSGAPGRTRPRCRRDHGCPADAVDGILHAGFISSIRIARPCECSAERENHGIGAGAAIGADPDLQRSSNASLRKGSSDVPSVAMGPRSPCSQFLQSVLVDLWWILQSTFFTVYPRLVAVLRTVVLFCRKRSADPSTAVSRLADRDMAAAWTSLPRYV